MSGTSGPTQAPGAEANPLSREFRSAELIRFALPTITVMVCMGLYTLADTIFVARYVGENALSAVNIACPVSNVIVGLAAMLASGGSAIVARKMGAGQDDQARRDFTLVIVVGAVIGAVVGGAGLIWIDPVVRALGASDLLFPFCKRYLLIGFAFAPACILQSLFQILIVASGRPGLGMALALAAGAVDIALDIVFMGPLHMGIAGAALSNGIGNILPVAVGAIYFANGHGSLGFRTPGFDLRTVAECLGNGSSELVGQLSTAISTFAFNVSMMRLRGETGVAAVTIMVFSQFMLSSAYYGFSMGVAPVISYSLGAGDRARTRRLLLSCLRFIAGLSIAVWAVSSALSDSIIGLYTPRGTPLRELAGDGLRVFAFGFLYYRLYRHVSRSSLVLRLTRDTMIVFASPGDAAAIGECVDEFNRLYPGSLSVILKEPGKSFTLQRLLAVI